MRALWGVAGGVIAAARRRDIVNDVGGGAKEIVDIVLEGTDRSH